MTPAPRVSRLWWFSGPVLLLLVAAVILVATMPVPYVVLAPGGARSVEPLIEISSVPGGPEVEADEISDDLKYVTVSTTMEPPGFWAAWSWWDDLAQVEPSAPYLGTQTSAENRRLNLERMTDSQDKARKVALERLGFEVVSEPIGAFLEDVDPDYPVADVVKPGTTIVGVDGQPVADVDDLVEAITAKAPGDEIVLQVLPLGSAEPTEVTTELGERRGDPTVPALGVTPVDRVRYEFPVQIDIDSGKVGGPSAGLAFTLAILDRMTPGALTGGMPVAVTGTIELDGRVGPVGGVRQKTEAAIREGAELFLVPPDELDDAVEAADGRLDVAAVSTLGEALAALEQSGGDPLPASTP